MSEICGQNSDRCRFCPQKLWAQGKSLVLHLHHTLTHLHYRVELTKECFHAGYFAVLVFDGKYLMVTVALLGLSLLSIFVLNGDE